MKRNEEIDFERRDVICYAGGVTLNRNSYICRISDKIKKGFPRTSNKNAETDAWNYLKLSSDKLGLTKRRSASKSELGEHIDKDMEQFVAGFFDGDGGISFNDNSIRVKVSQSGSSSETPGILTLIQSLYGGTIRLEKLGTGNIKTKWVLYQDSVHCQFLLKVVSNYGIVKRDQAVWAIERLQSDDAVILKTLKEKICNAKSNVNYSKVIIDINRLTKPYIAGFLDAEGCVALYGTSLRVIIAQKTNTRLLIEINRLYDNTGCVSGNHLYFENINNVRQIIKDVQPFLIMKKLQAETLYECTEYILTVESSKQPKRKTDYYGTLGFYEDDLKRMKHNV